MSTIFAPYRICPIGAHVDHQGGVVLGRTIDLGTTLDYEPLDSKELHITSDQFGETKFTIGDLDRAHWSRYAQAAARVLELKRGIRAHVSGSLIGSGLSSSASVGLAFIKALAEANEIELTAEQLVHLDYELEHEQLGLQNGLLDPMSIVYGQKNALLFIDPVAGSVTPIADPLPGTFAWVVAYSGVSRELTKSGFNVRVEECRQAAEALIPNTDILGDVPREIYEDRKNRLPENLRKRAAHFFTETDRVREGAKAWYEANLERFGELMNESCQSSIHNYEVGSDILIELHELLSSLDGVYGSRFSGGGYGGCVVALTDGASAETVCWRVAERFASRHPELPSKVFIAGTIDGLSSSPLAALPKGDGEMHSSPNGRRVGDEGNIHSAILLAAGRGKRQRPYTDVTPKPLLQVNGRPTLDYVLQAVVKAGIKRICMVTHHLEEKIFEYVGDGSKWNVSVTFAHQAELRGNGDALRSVPADWIRDEPVMVLATDYILDEDALLSLVEAYRKYHADITMSLKECPAEELTARSSVEVDSDWRVKRIIEKPKREEILSPYAASILFIFPPQVWDYITKLEPSRRGEIEMQAAVQQMIEDGYKAYGVLQPAPTEWDAAVHLIPET